MATATVQRPASLVKVAVEGTRLVSPLKDAVEELTITSSEDYTGADELLAGIRRARKTWDEKMEPILSPLRSAKTAADALKREIDRPLEVLEGQVKEKMRDFKVQEAAEIAREQARIDAAQQKIQRQLEDASAKELAARTKQMRERLATKRQELEEQAEEVAAEAPVATKAAHSGVRMVPKWRCSGNKETPSLFIILMAILAGQIPPEVVMLDHSFINRQHLNDRTVMANWPGFELYDETVIVGR